MSHNIQSKGEDALHSRSPSTELIVEPIMQQGRTTKVKKWSAGDIIFPNGLLASFQRSIAKGFPIASGSSNKSVVTPEKKVPFKVCSQGSLDSGWQVLELKKFLHLLFKLSYRGRQPYMTHSNHLLEVPPKYPKGGNMLFLSS